MGTFSPSITTGLFLADHTVVSLSWGLNLFILAVDSLGIILGMLSTLLSTHSPFLVQKGYMCSSIDTF